MTPPSDEASEVHQGEPFTFTVFTPTYNRAHTLHRVYESLRDQTLRNFEWAVVDDGSTDATAELMRHWQAEADFTIRYERQPRAGKHVAFNRAVAAARGTFFLTLDSDDACLPHALERFKHHWDAIPLEQRGKFSAVTSHCIDQHGNLVGDNFPHDPTDSDPLEIRYRHHVRGEKWGFHITSVLRRYPFPEIAGQPYVTESVVWNKIARSYRTRYVNEALRIYFVEPREKSLTKDAADAAARATMFVLSSRQTLDQDLRWFRFAPTAFAKEAANFARYSLHCGQGPMDQQRALTRPGARLLHAGLLPIGYALFRRDQRRKATRPPGAPLG